MTSVAPINVMPPRDRTMMWALLISLVVHAAVMLPYAKELMEKLNFEPAEVVEPVSIEFQLVSPPEQVIPTNQVSQFGSTVNSAAADSDPRNDDSAIPKASGASPFLDNPSPHDGALGQGKSDLPPIPDEVSDLGQAFEKSQYVSQYSARQDEALPEQVPEFFSDRSARASIGGIQLSTTAWDFAPYLLDLKHRIRQNWVPPMAFTALGAISGYTWVQFRIYPDGTMERLSVVEEEGHGSLHKSSVGAITGAAPFRPLPKHFPEEYLEIRFGFYYLLPGDEERFFKKTQQQGSD